MSRMRKPILLIFILAVSVTVFWLTYNTLTKTTVNTVKEKRDKNLIVLLSKSKSYPKIYNRVSSKTHSLASGKALVSYLEALYEGDPKKLQGYLPRETAANAEKSLITFYQALDYNTLKVGYVLPEAEKGITKIQLSFSVNGIEISKTINMFRKNKKSFTFFETNEMQMDTSNVNINDPVLSAILAQFGKGMDYQPVIPAIAEFTKDGVDKQTAYNYPLLLSLSTVKKIDKLSYEGPYFQIGFDNIVLLISRTRNDVQAELNHSELYQLKGGEKEMKAMQDYAAAFIKH